jgi:hypothetical protein
MTLKPARLELCVEGRNDLFALSNLMRLHGAPDYTSEPPAGWPRYAVPQKGSERDVTELIRTITPLVLAGSDPLSSIGFVVDADNDPARRWTSIRDRLSAANVKSPGKIPLDGFVGKSADGCRVGVWMMPDNHGTGGLESFLLKLVPSTDPLRRYASRACFRAKALGAPFKQAHFEKARIHTWLAWQDEPGHPFGTSLHKGVFDHECSLAMRFVRWFKELYQIDG